MWGKIERGLERPPTYCFFFCQNLVFDPETNAVLRAEMAKKNLYVKRGKNLFFLSISVNAFTNRIICMFITVLFTILYTAVIVASKHWHNAYICVHVDLFI